MMQLDVIRTAQLSVESHMRSVVDVGPSRKPIGYRDRPSDILTDPRSRATWPASQRDERAWLTDSGGEESTGPEQ